MVKRTTGGVYAGLLIGLLAAPSARAQTYVIQDLGTLTGRNSAATAGTDNGYVAGYSAISGDFNGEPWFLHAFRWQGGAMTDLGVLGPDVPPEVFPKPDSQALDVNTLGQVVGKSVQPGQAYKGFLWLPAPAYGFPPGMNALPELPGGSTIAAGINSSGWIVGESRPQGSLGPRPVLWRYVGTQWTLTDLGDLGGPYGRAHAINEQGQVCGETNVPGGSMRSFLWLPKPDYGLTAGMHDIDPAQGQSSAADVNEKGQIVGVIGAGQTFLWLPQPDYGLPSGTTLLSFAEIPDAVAAWPQSVNESGVVVGQVARQYYIDPPGIRITEYHAMIWQDGHMRLLEDLLPGSGWWLTNAYEVTPAGRIVGHGVSPLAPENGHAFRMTPVRPGDMNCDGAVDFDDISAFVSALVSRSAYEARYPDCPWLNGDMDANGDVDFDDIGPFVMLLTGRG
jgi:probable HAF family extracellular repeat protein